MQDPVLDILEDIRGGDVRKYALLVDQYKDRGLALAIRIVRRRQDAEDLLQDAFVRAYHAIRNFRGDSSFGTWFYRILYNLCLSHVRRTRPDVDPFDPLDDENIDTIVGMDDGADALLALEDRDLFGLLESELDHLPGQYRIPLTLFYLQELSYKEIAVIMETPIGTVKTNLHRARQMLRLHMLKILAQEEAI